MKLMVSGLRKGDQLKLTCAGKGCAFKHKKMKARSSRMNMLRLFKKRALRPKAVITLWVMRPGTIGQVMKFTVRKGKKPKQTKMCVPMGSSKARARC
jgi:hypothetical protein